ncbi:DUF2505 domain-containing protein [Nocardioides sambongensis]|uniref:DUF2505 domain-containing protein n=1 Tax=Nocardioides sambongensis TaxID=2589074 RepID=UPI00112B60D5|nr:DUF2505 domain-containing protein [Nocardioides sambongensis]
MTKRLVHTMTYDAPVDAVAAMLADPSFREEVCRNQRATSYDVRVEGSHGDPMRLRVEMTQPTDKVPSFAKKVVGSSTTIVLTETWPALDRGELHIEIPGKPGAMAGTVVLEESGGVTTETVTLDVTVRIPLVGGKIEDLLAQLMGSAMRAEERTGKAYLAR